TSGEKRVFLVILFTSFSGSLVSRIPGAVHIVACALANKLARIAWAITALQKEYQA
ncbi:hypothetical protein GQP77_25280, partial [Escherichia coli]|nr:hypothetical protein [Escherichia coli]EFI3437818.1 hypothetical protein [Escherichia coli]